MCAERVVSIRRARRVLKFDASTFHYRSHRPSEAALGDSPALPSARSKKSLARVSSPILACRVFTSTGGASAPTLGSGPNTPAAPSRSWAFHWVIWLGCTSNCWASSARVSLRSNGRENPLQVVQVRCVGADGVHAAVLRVRLLRFMAPRDEDVSTFLTEPVGDGTADAARSSDDERNFVRQVAHEASLPR